MDSRITAQLSALPPASAPAVPPSAGQPNKEMFFKLLVAQIRNQNPLDPASAVEFLTQLTQFTSLEQMIEMRASLDAIRKSLEPRAPPTPIGEPLGAPQNPTAAPSGAPSNES